MSVVDDREYRVTGASTGALQAYERALGAFLAWRNGAEALLAPALLEAPTFVMAHVLQAYLFVGSRDPQRVRSARPALARAAALPANDRERMHLGAIAAVLGDDYADARARLGELLRAYPLDSLALQAAHSLDYLAGDAKRMSERVAAVLPAWSGEVPGHHAVLAMHAFGLEECGHYERAEEVARAALASNRFDARAHHTMAHVFEMTSRADAGVRWLNEHLECWGQDTLVATHGWWHMALFHLAQGWPDLALGVYDRRIRRAGDAELADLIDAAALLWRLELRGCDVGTRWSELTAGWAAHIDDAFCSFTDLHATIAFVGAQDWDRAQRLERSLSASAARPTRHGETTRLLGLPACRALIAFGRGDDGLAITLLAGLPARSHRLGGSHAQRELLLLTLLRATERLCRRPARAPRIAPVRAIARRSIRPQWAL